MDTGGKSEENNVIRSKAEIKRETEDNRKIKTKIYSIQIFAHRQKQKTKKKVDKKGGCWWMTGGKRNHEE